MSVGVSMRVTVGCVRIRGYKDEELVYEMCGMWDVWGVSLWDVRVGRANRARHV